MGETHRLGNHRTVKSADWVAIIYTGPGGFSLGWLESLRFWFMAKKQRMMV